MVLDNIVKYTKPDLKQTLLAKRNDQAADRIEEARRLLTFIDRDLEDDASRGRDRERRRPDGSANRLDKKERWSLVCAHCGIRGHVIDDCRKKRPRTPPTVKPAATDTRLSR